MTNLSIVLCLIMASVQPLSTSLPPMGIFLDIQWDSWKTEFVYEALDWAGETDVVATILKDTLNRVDGAIPRPRSTPGGSPGTNEEQERDSKEESKWESNGGSKGGSKRAHERSWKFFKHFQKLLELLDEDQLVRPVCEFAFDFLELTTMRFLTSSPKGIALKQGWPTETAEIEAVLARVKSQMEGVKEDFSEAMRVVQQAVSAPNTQERTQALRRYEAIKSVIQPVFDTCLKFMKQAQVILKTLEPKVENVIEESREKAVTKSSYTVAAAVVAAFTFTGAWMVAAPAALVITGVSYGTAIQQRHDLRGDLEHYNKEIMVIIDLETMKSKLKSGHDFLFDQTKKGGVTDRLLDHD